MEPRILVVDDFATMRQILKNVLLQAGYKNVGDAPDGGVALMKLKTEGYNFVITDWNMPQMSGLELVKAIRANPMLKKTAILMVTAEAKKELIIEAAQAGADGYIVKPITPDVLKQKIEKVLEKRK